ncbi:MAG: O-antigen polymerase [Microgenomates group bacterium GW2011_GWA2_46_7]|nr:MAG: O-antigen polymerase [Microgenomates group bacterium GW2011_GWA2_46_7]
MRKILRWLDEHLLLILTGILLVVIPAYPKLPLADLIEGYIVRLRLEDILVLLAFVVYLVQLMRRKITFPQSIVAKLILAYLIFGFLSTLSAMFLTHTVPLERQHILKLYLHFFRRVEYFSLFFIAYSAVKSRKDILTLLKISGLTLLAVVIYGYGQKYFLWPAFSTMNREFSKGTRLYLTANSRVMSTFAGHYDYAAYLMMSLSLIVAYLWTHRKCWVNLLLIIFGLAVYWSLILTASRTSFIGYLVGITVVALVLKKLRLGIHVFWRYLVVMVASFAIMLTMGDLADRFFSVIRNPDLIVHDLTQVLPIKREWISNPLSLLGSTLGSYGDRFIAMRQKLNTSVATPPPGSLSTDEIEKVASLSDTPPSTAPPLPPDVSAAEDAFRKEQEALQNAPSPPPGSGYSPNALKYGLSVAIRLDALWPRARDAFWRNPLLGSGYSTLTKATNEEFTIAESTDNDYLRMLGETGILGTLTFLAIPLLVAFYGYRLAHDPREKIFSFFGLAMIGVVISLLVNAAYIDVFESSKIAYLFWVMCALVVRANELRPHDQAT